MPKVAELEGALLDYWIARVEGLRVEIRSRCAKQHAYIFIDTAYQKGIPRIYSPSLDWVEGGPIIELARIQIAPVRNKWLACHEAGDYSGPTPLIAAMRAYVASKFGDTVPDEVDHG
jgi:hypothetical protein